MRGGDGLFEVEPVEGNRPDGRAAAVDKRFRAFDPHQVLLLPPSLDDWLPQDHLARFVADLVGDVPWRVRPRLSFRPASWPCGSPSRRAVRVSPAALYRLDQWGYGYDSVVLGSGV
ncbi:hypothetical protein [Actinacidiphila oryziradicis]